MDEWFFNKTRNEFTLRVDLEKENYILGIADEEGWSVIINYDACQSTFINCEKESVDKIKENAYNMIMKIKEDVKKYLPQLS